MGYFKATARGISWVGGFRVFSRVVSFSRTIILARILVPSQFGVYAIATLVLAVLEVFTETGINVFLVQKKGNVDKYIDTAWIVSIARGLLIGSLIYFSSGFVADFFESPSVIPLLMLVSLVPVARGFINPSVAKFQKELLFGKDFFVRSSVFVVDSLVSILATLVLNSPIGIIWGLLTGSILEIILTWVLARPTPRIGFNYKRFKEVVLKGRWVTFYGMFNYLNGNIDDALVGKMLSTSSLGVYQMAYKLSTLPLTEVTQVFNKVTFPVYVKISDDKERLKRAFSKTFFVVTLFSTSIGLVLYFSADFLIPILLGQNWLIAIPALKVLSVYGVIRAVSSTTFSVYLANEKQSYVASILFIEFITLVSLLYPFINQFGLLGAGYATIISVLIPTPLNIFYLTLSFKRSK